MNERALRRALDDLTRTELHALATDLVSWTGAEATARFSDTAPFARAEDDPQLLFTAVDVNAAATRLDDLQAFALAAIRAFAGGHATMATLFADPTFDRGLQQGFDHVASDTIAALQFDFPTGLKLADQLFATAQRITRAQAAFDEVYAPPALPLHGVFACIGERTATTALNEGGLRALVDLCVRAHAVGTPDAWAPIQHALSSGLNPRALRWLQRKVTEFDTPPVVLGLLATMARFANHEPDVFLEAAEQHLVLGRPVYGLLVEVMGAAGRVTEAQFWRGELGRLA